MHRLVWTACDSSEAWGDLLRAPVVLAGEFHALDSACRSAAELIERWSADGWPTLLALELVHARHQQALDAFLAGSIGERELRRRVRYREEWGYPWSGPQRLLRTARRLGVPAIGLDLSPRGSAADLERRDRIAAERLALSARSASSTPKVVVVVGEAHLQRGHLPRELTARWPAAESAARVLHDADLPGLPDEREWARSTDGWWHRCRRPRGARLPALARVYRRWAEDPMGPEEIDLGLMADGLIEAELGAIGFDPRRRRLGPGRWLPDIYPETFPLEEPRRAGRRLREAGWSARGVRRALEAARSRGALLLPDEGILLASGSSLRGLARETGLFGALALRRDGVAWRQRSFWERLAIEAMGFALARTVDPGLPAATPGDAVAGAGAQDRLARALGSWLGEGLAQARERGELASATLRRWLSERYGAPEPAIRWIRRAVALAGPHPFARDEETGGAASG